MTQHKQLRRTIMASAMALAMCIPSLGHTCTSLLYTDANGSPMQDAPLS